MTLALVLLAPGDPFYSVGAFKGAFIAQVLIVWFLLRGSKVAWWIALFFTAGAVLIYGYVTLFPQGQLGFGSKAMAAMLLEAAAVVFLTAPALEASLGRKRPRTATGSA